MKLIASIGCSSCGFTQELDITLPFNCDDIACPKCREYAMSITSMQDFSRVKEKANQIDELLKGLYKIRQL